MNTFLGLLGVLILFLILQTLAGSLIGKGLKKRDN